MIIIGDFNHPHIKWSEDDSHTYPNSAQEFITTLEDCFLQQLILKPTRHREGQTSSILDILLTNTPDTINNIK